MAQMGENIVVEVAGVPAAMAARVVRELCRGEVPCIVSLDASGQDGTAAVVLQFHRPSAEGLGHVLRRLQGLSSEPCGIRLSPAPNVGAAIVADTQAHSVVVVVGATPPVAVLQRAWPLLTALLSSSDGSPEARLTHYHTGLNALEFSATRAGSGCSGAVVMRRVREACAVVQAAMAHAAADTQAAGSDLEARAPAQRGRAAQWRVLQGRLRYSSSLLGAPAAPLRLPLSVPSIEVVDATPIPDDDPRPPDRDRRGALCLAAAAYGCCSVIYLVQALVLMAKRSASLNSSLPCLHPAWVWRQCAPAARPRLRPHPSVAPALGGVDGRVNGKGRRVQAATLAPASRAQRRRQQHHIGLQALQASSPDENLRASRLLAWLEAL